MRRKKHSRHNRFAATLCFVGMFLLSIAPTLPGFARSGHLPGNIDLSAYALPDGSSPFICFNSSGDPAPETDLEQHCPLCTLAKVVALPPRIAAIKVSLPVDDVIRALPERPVVQSPILSANRSRAPPATA